MNRIIFFVLVSVLLLSCSKKTFEAIPQKHIVQPILTIESEVEKEEINQYVSTEHLNHSVALKFLSINYRFNSFTTHNNILGRDEKMFYFYGFDGYSEAILWYSSPSSFPRTLMLKHYGSQDSFSTFGDGYPLGLSYNEYEGHNGGIGYRTMLGASYYYGYEYVMENEKLISWSIASETYWIETSPYEFRPLYISNKIEELVNSMLIYYNENEVYAHYELISRDDLFNIFITLYLDGIDYILGGWREKQDPGAQSYDDDHSYFYAIQGRTKKELEIFRNYIFVRHGYKFTSEEWNNFFTTYRQDYRGTKTHDQVVEEFNRTEKYVLELITQEENKFR